MDFLSFLGLIVGFGCIIISILMGETPDGAFELVPAHEPFTYTVTFVQIRLYCGKIYQYRENDRKFKGIIL